MYQWFIAVYVSKVLHSRLMKTFPITFIKFDWIFLYSFYLCGRSILLSLCIKCPVVVWIEREDNHLVIWLANGDTIQTPKTAFETSWVNKRALYLQDVHIVHSNNKNENSNPSFIAEYINSCRLRNSMLGIGEWTYLVQIVPLFCYT